MIEDFYRRVLILASVILMAAFIVDVFVKYYIKIKKKSHQAKITKCITSLDEFLIGLMAAMFITLMIVSIMFPITWLIQYLVSLW